MPNSSATAASAGSRSGLSLGVRVWKILAPLLPFSIDARRDSLDPTTVDFCESTDARAPPPARLAVDSPPNGDDVDARDPVRSLLRENDLLRRGRPAFDSASICSNTDKQPGRKCAIPVLARRPTRRPLPDQARPSGLRTFHGFKHAVYRVVFPERNKQVLHRRQRPAAISRCDPAYVRQYMAASARSDR